MLSVIMPTYNESQSLEKTVTETVATLQKRALDYEIIVVDDGSTDNTREIALSLAGQNPRVKAFGYRENRGKGFALNYGFQQAKGDQVVLIDADSDLPPSQIPQLLTYMRERNADVVNTSKRHVLSQVEYPVKRRFMSWGYQTMVKILFRIPLSDTLTGLKLFKHEVLKEVFSRARADGFAFSFELLLCAHRLGYKIVEAPIEIKYNSQSGSNVNFKSILKIFWETLAIFYRANFRHHYDKKGGSVVVVALVGVYPLPETKHTSGQTPYVKNLALAIKKNHVKLTVFANKLEGSEDEYTEKSIRVVRCWTMSLLHPFQICRQVCRLRSEVDVIHIQHEYFYYGGAIAGALFPFMLLLLKVLGKPIVVTMHGVISISGFGDTFARENRLKGNPRILKFGLWVTTKLIGLLADRLIVHEGFLADILAHEYGIRRGKIATIHHGIEEDALGDGSEIKKRLGFDGKKVTMFFGYFSGYKGLHILIDVFTNLKDQNIVLIVVGEENPRMTADRHYQEYIKRLKSQATRLADRIRFVGFVPEKEMPAYFSAADVVILPYTLLMSASGPLTQCVTYRRPFLLSEPFKKVVGKHSFLFKAEPEPLRKKVEEFFTDSRLEKEALDCAATLALERSWSIIGKETANLYQILLKNKGESRHV